MMLDSAIFNYHKNLIDNTAPPTNMTILTQDYPHTQTRFLQGYDAISALGSFYFFIAPMITFIVVLEELVAEKEKRLRQGLGVVGVSASEYWISWVILSFIWSVLISIILILSGMACQFSTFLHTPFLILFLTFFLFSFSMQFLVYLIYTLVPTTHLAYSVGYGILLLGLVIEIILSNITIVYYLYIIDSPTWVVWFRSILLLYPPFNFSKIMADISIHAGSTFSVAEGRWIQGPGYYWSELNTLQLGTIQGRHYKAWSTLTSLLFLLMDISIFALFAWYFDHIISHNRGRDEKWNFFMSYNYCFCTKRAKSLNMKKDIIMNETKILEIIEEDSILREKEKILSLINDKVESNGIRIFNVSKTFKMGFCGTSSKNDVHALKNLFLEIEDGELLGLLGHNGAGKTTLIGILTGVLSQTEGEVTICGYDVKEDIEELREIIGVCPQFNILWGELTAYEHMYMFAEIKRVPKSDIEPMINKKLKEVNLLNVKDAQVSTFSGGMKRRLSVAISGVGDPKVLFLDEPTTGMDPEGRRQVWDLIMVSKKNQILCM